MLNIEKWAKGKPELIAISAVQLVTFADFLYEVLPQAKERRLFGRQFPLPDFASWHRMYQTPLKPLSAFVGMISEFCEKGPVLIGLIIIARKFQRLLKRNPNHFRDNPPSLKQIQEGRAIVKNLFSSTFSEIKDGLDPQPVDPEEKARFNHYLKKYEQELGFFFFLYVPSLLIFQKTPYRLYREAITGDIESIEKLLKLDPIMLHEQVIGKHIQFLRFSNKTSDYERVTVAALKPALTEYTDIADARKRSKVELAAIIAALSQLAGKRLTSTNIARLFDAYAKDKQEGEIDADLPAAESFNKAIKRHIQPWHDLFQKPDINK